MNAKDFNDKFKEINGYDYHNNIVIDSTTADEVVAHIDLTEISYNPWQIAHGGLLFGLADISIGVLCFMNNIEGVTINADINYLKPCKKYVKAIAKKIKMGKTICVFNAELFNENDELAAIVTMNYFNMK